MMREGREELDSTRNRSSRREMILRNEVIEENERYRTRHSSVEERGYDFGTMRGYEDGQLRKVPRSNGQGYPVRDNDTASKFQWTNLLKESGNYMADGAEGAYEGSGHAKYGRKYDGLVEKSALVENEMIGNPRSHAYNVGGADYHGGSRNMSGHAVEDPTYRGHNRIGIDRPVEDVRYNRHTRNVTDLPIEDAGYSGRTREVTGLLVKDAHYRSHSRTVKTDLPIEDADYQRGTRNVGGPLVEDRRRFFPREYPGHMDREISMRSYEEHNWLRFRNEDSSHSLTPRSHSNGQLTSIQETSFSNLEGTQLEVFHHLGDGRGTGGGISPSNCYGSPRIAYPQANDASPVSHKVINRPRAEYNPNMGRHVDCTLPESQRSRKVYRRLMSQEIYDNYENVQNYHDHEDLFGNDTLDPDLPRHVSIGNSGNYDHTPREELIVDLDDVSMIGHNHKIKQGGANLQSMNRYRKYEIEDGDETMLLEEDCHYEKDSYGVPYEHESWTYPALAEGAFDVYEDAQQRLQSENIDSHDQPKRIPKRKRGFIEKTRLPKQRTSTLDGRGTLSYDNRYYSAVPEDESVYPNRCSSAVAECESIYPRRSSSLFQSKGNARMSKTDARLPYGGLSKELRSRLSKPGESGKISVKKRLNPHFVPRHYGSQSSKVFGEKTNSFVRSSLNINHTTSAPPPFGQTQRTSVKSRLKAAPHMDVCSPDSQVSHLGLNSDSRDNLDYKKSRTAKEAGALKEADPDYSILKVKPTEKDPPDNSEEHKRLVDYWFIKCMLYLNANPGRLKKFKEQGKAGTLKCSICSSPKEFTQTKDVATHAFTSPKVGLRAPHLGFHKALCVLMGWDPAITSNGRWVCKSLSDVEARALKEDLILWPPVVIIHKGSAGDFFTNEPANISFQQLENTLRDMGLKEEKTTICHGKPGCPNLRLVKFNGTVSGLQEAERLHNLFSEKNHGRAQLQEVDNGVRCSEGVAQEAENKFEDTLYGYLGTVEDFDKLNYELRRHCVAKSKKEILGSVDTAT